MKTLFDTSVLVAASVDQLPSHEIARAAVVRSLESKGDSHASTHAVAECFATLTALPLKQRISPLEAQAIIETNLLKRFDIVALDQTDYAEAVATTVSRGLTSGSIYDALHLIAARKGGCERLLTYNLAHFRRFAADDIEISAP